ncbi:hypothetical protein AMS68_001787 [Peltaster fructicola]|uniref:Uncharacterized protein n=1 Tax=Peltaster fructicola TaxID=286661 RepID=A0A6H0XP56_9PEZI|nr:hypothetical protein AMS68_001787 [Peltaster fructicola]
MPKGFEALGSTANRTVQVEDGMTYELFDCDSDQQGMLLHQFLHKVLYPHTNEHVESRSLAQSGSTDAVVHIARHSVAGAARQAIFQGGTHAAVTYAKHRGISDVNGRRLDVVYKLLPTVATGLSVNGKKGSAKPSMGGSVDEINPSGGSIEAEADVGW